MARGPHLGYPRTENSTDLTHYFWEGPKFTFEKIKKAFWELWGAKDIMTLLPGLWGAWPDLPPGSASGLSGVTS